MRDRGLSQSRLIVHVMAVPASNRDDIARTSRQPEWNPEIEVHMASADTESLEDPVARFKRGLEQRGMVVSVLQSRGEGDASQLNREVGSLAREAAAEWRRLLGGRHRGGFAVVVNGGPLAGAAAAAKRAATGVPPEEFGKRLTFPVGNMWALAATLDNVIGALGMQIGRHVRDSLPNRYPGPGPLLVVGDSLQDLDDPSILDRGDTSAQDRHPDNEPYDRTRDGYIVLIAQDRDAPVASGPAEAGMSAAVSASARDAGLSQPVQRGRTGRSRGTGSRSRTRARQVGPAGPDRRTRGAARGESG